MINLDRQQAFLSSLASRHNHLLCGFSVQDNDRRVSPIIGLVFPDPEMFGSLNILTRVRLQRPLRHSKTYKRLQVLSLQTFLPAVFRFSSNSTLSTNMSQNSDISRVLSFWFDRPPVQWFQPPEGFDSECNDHFGDLVHDARADKLDSWAAEPESAIALLILLDQFSRNIFRNTPEMYAADDKAFDIATRCIAKGFDEKVSPMQALTFYLPLMHHESLLAQVATVALYKKVIARSPEGSEALAFHSRGIHAAFGHLDVVERFGRFPSRNKILGRETTKEEHEFLEKNPSGFDQARENPKPEEEAKI
jgi:uncharacterized protein (DUF924 family)